MLLRKLLIGTATVLLSSQAIAASGEMGTGIPQFGSYSSATGTRLAVWSLADASRPMAAGCSSLILSPETMGLEAYKIGVALLTAAKLTDRRVRFYAHGERDGGCGVDYVEIL
jgi:hypothetical protein